MRLNVQKLQAYFPVGSENKSRLVGTYIGEVIVPSLYIELFNFTNILCFSYQQIFLRDPYDP